MKFSEFTTEEKVRLDPKCWSGKKIGTPKTKVKGGVRVNNCVPAESVNEAEGRVDPLLIRALERMPDGLNSHGQVLNAAYDAYAMELGRMEMKSN